MKLSPLHLCITGGAGTGTGNLIKIIHAALSKTLSYVSYCNDKPNVLLLAPTGVAAININETTIHSGLGIPFESRGMTVPKLPDKRRCNLRIDLSDVKAIIIDEISMVSNNFCYIFIKDYDKPFAGFNVILGTCAVMQKPVYT